LAALLATSVFYPIPACCQGLAVVSHHVIRKIDRLETGGRSLRLSLFRGKIISQKSWFFSPQPVEKRKNPTI
jgi:hypothetical protein